MGRGVRDDAIRLDKWLWFARFCPSRGDAQKLVEAGRIRVNRQVTAKAATVLRRGDVLTFALGPHVRVVRVMELGRRRGPAREARLLYDDLAPPPRRSPIVLEEKRAG
jgi:ribosome-associated heat shock protein Hsp15